MMLVHMFQFQSVHRWPAFYATLGTTLFRELSCPFVKLTQSEAEARPSLGEDAPWSHCSPDPTWPVYLARLRPVSMLQSRAV